MRITLSFLFFIHFLCGIVYAQKLTIPGERPRIWWSESTWEAALSKYEAAPFQPRARGDFEEIESGGWKWNNEVPIQNALYYLINGDEVAAQTAIAWAKYNLAETLEMEMDEEGISCDRCRWWLQEIILVYDWCYPELTEKERAYFLQEISNVVERWNGEQRWGTPDEPASNYNQGYMRNSFLWGVASYGEHDKAQQFIDHALDERWAGFEAYFDEENLSGIPTEGTSYGHTILNYMLVMFETAKNCGLDLFGHPFFRKSVMFTIYHTTPGPTLHPQGDGNYATFPFGDASAFWDSRFVAGEFAPFMFYAAHYYQGTRLSELIYDWADQLELTPDDVLLTYLVDPQEGSGISELPLDYYPPTDGTIGQAFSRTAWGTEASAIHFQLIAPELGGHEHQDALNFSWWRKGSFMTMEVPGRGFGSGWQVPDYDGQQQVDVQASIAHNTLLFGAEGQTGSETQKATVLRLQSDEDFFYAAVDGTNAYKSHYDDVRYYNEYVEHVEREFLFIKPMETLVIFDRMMSNVEADDLRKTFVLHLLGTPEEVGQGEYQTAYHDQSVFVKTFLPVDASAKVIYEGDGRAEYEDFYRLQVETEADTTEYFLHVIQVRDEDETNVEVSLSEGESGYSLTFSHPEKGFARLFLDKGVESAGGAFAYAPNAIPSELHYLHDTVQLRELTLTGGFKWLNLDGSGGTVLSNNPANDVLIWPNPARNGVHLRGLASDITGVVLFNSSGRQVRERLYEGGYLDLTDMPPGLYVLKVSTRQGELIKRLLIE